MELKLTHIRLGWMSLLGLIFLTLILLVFESFSNTFGLLNRSSSQSTETIGMGGEPWRTYANLHDTPVFLENNVCKTCHNFFGLWPSDCVDNYDILSDKIKTISAQMIAMATNFTLITTSPKNCVFSYPNINVLVINTTDILLECGFAPAFSKMDSWKKSRYTRISDILRVCLAAKYNMAYMDTDVHYLNLNRTLFECPYVGAQMWANARNSIEITNAAFCLPTGILHAMSRYQVNRIIKGSDDYFYTELGPSMFHNVSTRVIILCKVIFTFVYLILFNYL